MYYNFLSNWNVFRTFACYDEMYAYENKRMERGKTILFISHRESGLAVADNVVTIK